jgi:hypothetical protein
MNTNTTLLLALPVLLLAACDPSPSGSSPSATAASVSEEASPSPDVWSFEDYLGQSTIYLGEIELQANTPCPEQDAASFIDDLDLAGLATTWGKALPDSPSSADDRSTEYRFNENDVVRVRRDKQSLRFFFGDRQWSPIDLLADDPLPSEQGVALAMGVCVDLGLPEDQIGDVSTDVIEYSVEHVVLGLDERYQGNRVVLVERRVDGWKVHHSKVVLKLSNSGELVSGRVNWPAFRVAPEKIGLPARGKEDLAFELAARVYDNLRGKPFSFSSPAEVVWIPLRDGMETTFAPAIAVNLFAQGGEDPYYDELYLQVY